MWLFFRYPHGALWGHIIFGSIFAQSICRDVCPSPPGNHASQWTWDFWSKSELLNLANLYVFFCFFTVSIIFRLYNFFWDIGSLQSSLLCIVGELAGKGSVAVAVGFSDRWKVTCDMCYSSCDTWQVTCDTWHKT